MSPENIFQEYGETKMMIINGPRPSPLSVNKSSHVIQKPSSSSCLTKISSQVPAAKQQNPNPNAQHMQPVIIYTHSPKIIHTHARDFMALVQKLTGLSRSEDEISPAESQEKSQVLASGNKDDNMTNVSLEDNESSSVITDEKCCGGSDDVKESSSMVSPMNKMPNANFADIPLFTPNSIDFFCSPPPSFRFPDGVFPSPNMGNAVSSFLEFMKELPEY